MASENIVELRGVKVLLRRGGTGEQLLFLHGPQGLPGFIPGLERLSRHFDVLAPDHPGFGGSDSAEIDDVQELAFFYLDLLKSVGPAHVVGHSLGGWVALEMAIRCTSDIKSLTLVGSAGIRLEGVPRADMFMYPAAELPSLLFAGDGTAWAEAWQERQDIADRNRGAAAKYCWQPRLYRPNLARWLHRVDVPTLILWGADDKVIPSAHAEALQSLIPGARLELLPRSGHLLPEEHPDGFAAAVGDFIEGLGA